MNRIEAATFLGVSVRTLDRLVKTGKVARGCAFNGSRKQLVFSETELVKVKERILAGRRVFWEPSSEQSNQDNYVNFRIDDSYAKRLKAVAETHGLSPGQYARQLVIQAIDGRYIEAAEEIRAVRSALAAIFYLLLTSKMGTSPAEATKIVNETIWKRKT